ncbi:polysaccharide deacetylase family protein [Sinanaerobacter sp. ZZT-01]|uniref:polysaccharide deacetylase family protein n=1 Tax=Sinanaerobacter sp. ZZT-01 TaxID=3111540 RepID=UPI002D768E1D|nr:polysaccharide deacetylase family protein [Sinanaerobacter sp. ZZT-01]WRR92403.1 polysaccharide deacetylase family protein [Sinanaerobacter sp. ZZT-01]
MIKSKRIISILLLFLIVTIVPYTAFATSECETKQEIDPDKPMIALTFDDGPSTCYTSRILDVLEENNVNATFFVLGTEAEENQDLLARMIENGNEIGNHTLNHQDLTSLTDEEISYQINTTQQIIQNATGTTSQIMRAPYGYIDEDTSQQIDMPVILWSLDTLDWENRDAEIICDTILKNVKDGDIVLMHDIYESTADAAEYVIPELIKRGYQLVTVSELSEYKGISLEDGTTYNNFY